MFKNTYRVHFLAIIFLDICLRCIVFSHPFKAGFMLDIIFVADINYTHLLHLKVLQDAKENNDKVKNNVHELFMKNTFCNKTKTLLTTLDEYVFGSGFHVRLSYIIIITFVQCFHLPTCNSQEYSFFPSFVIFVC